MRTAFIVILLTATSCNSEPSPGLPMRLVGSGGSDTIVINTRRPTSLPIRVLDARGRAVEGALVRFVLDSGQQFPLTPTGDVSCSDSGDYAVRASVAALNTRIIIHCRPVDNLQIPGPLQFILGDSVLGQPRDVPVRAYGAGGQPVELIAGSLGIMDSDIASLSGITMTPHAPGASLAWAIVGGREARIGVHVYQRVDGIDALDTVTRIPPDRRLIAVQFLFAAGEVRRTQLPPGTWMIAMLPEEERGLARIRFRVEGAACHPVLTERRFICGSQHGATLMVYRPFEPAHPATVGGELLLRWLGAM